MKTRVTAVAAAVIAALGVVGATGLTPSAHAQTCAPLGSTATVNDGFPGRMSSLVGVDIRTGGHECFERVVLELGGTGELPGYQVGYQPDPILDDPRGEPVDVAGAATLVLWVGAWMPTMEGDGYSGPIEITPTNVSSILELVQISNFEGQTAWAIGLDSERDFAVSTLRDPVRIVIDIATSDGTTGPSLPPTR